MEKRNYMELVRYISPSIGDLGYSDGYNDLDSDAKEIINQLFGLESADFIIDAVSLYLQGYELGCDASEDIEEVYDEDGNMKKNWLEALPLSDHVDEATCLFKEHIHEENKKIILKRREMLRNFDKLPK